MDRATLHPLSARSPNWRTQGVISFDGSLTQHVLAKDERWFSAKGPATKFYQWRKRAMKLTNTWGKT